MIHRKLNRQLSKALNVSKLHHHHRIVLELFSGSAGLSHAFGQLGFGSVAIDIAHGDHNDLTNPIVQNVIKGWLTSKVVIAV